jgi:acetyl esterase/lipase
MMSIRSKAVITAVKKGGLLSGPINADNLDLMRSRFLKLEKFFPKPRWAQVTPILETNFKGEWIVAPQSSSKRVVLYIHGGGFVFNGTKLYRNLISRIAKSSHAKVFSLDYSLAPEHPFPAALEEALAAYKWLLKEYDSGSIAVMGDSAGGALALSLQHVINNKKLAKPACMVVLSPPTDATLGSESIQSNKAKDFYINSESLQFFSDAYFAKTPRDDPVASPLHGSFNEFPPMLIHVEKSEIMYDDSARLAQKAKLAGVNVAFEVGEDLFHVWHIFALYMPEARKSVEAIGNYIYEHTRN